MREMPWEGKYDTAGRRIAPPRLVLPFHTVDPVGESTRDPQPVGEKWHLVAVSKAHHARRIGYGLFGAN